MHIHYPYTSIYASRCSILIVIFLLGPLHGHKGQCDKEDGCDELSGKPVILSATTSAKDTQHHIHYPPLHDPHYLIPGGEYPNILWWHDHIYPHPKHVKQIDCSLGTCTVSKDRKTLKKLLTRGIIFYGTSIENDDFPLPRLPHHEWALFHEESPKNKWMLSTELGISLFNHTATFRRESDYPLSTHWLRNPDAWLDDKYFVSTKEKNRLQKSEGLGVLVYVQSDCNPPSDRDAYVKELMKHVKVDSYGNCVNNKQLPSNIKGFKHLAAEDYLKFLARYKFQIAIENALCSDYMTEKLFRPLEIGSVPVYLGSDKVRDFMPSRKSVILIKDFPSPKELAAYLHQLNDNDELYEGLLAHRRDGISNPDFHESVSRQPWKVPPHQKINFSHFMFAQYSCHVCDQIHKRNSLLKEHLRNKSQPLLPLRQGKLNHLGCPMGKPLIEVGRDHPYYHARDIAPFQAEAQALSDMMLANETDSGKWERYLK